MLYILWKGEKKNIHSNMIKILNTFSIEKYGPTIKFNMLGQTMVHTIDPAAIKVCFIIVFKF
jgi:hypothetical protein